MPQPSPSGECMGISIVSTQKLSFLFSYDPCFRIRYSCILLERLHSFIKDGRKLDFVFEAIKYNKYIF